MTPHPWIERAHALLVSLHREAVELSRANPEDQRLHALLVSLHREAVELSRANPEDQRLDNAAAHLTVALTAFEILAAGDPPKEGRP